METRTEQSERERKFSACSRWIANGCEREAGCASASDSTCLSSLDLKSRGGRELVESPPLDIFGAMVVANAKHLLLSPVSRFRLLCFASALAIKLKLSELSTPNRADKQVLHRWPNKCILSISILYSGSSRQLELCFACA